MDGLDDRDAGRTLTSDRLELEPLRLDHAEQMSPLLDDPRLHTYIGGEPPTLDQLRERYAYQVVGRSPDGTQRWLNWVVRRRGSGEVVGTVQATVGADAGGTVAEVAWVIGTGHQGNGYAKESAQVVAAWLRERGVVRLVAHVHPDHAASAAVARAIGLTATDTIVDGEVEWRSG